MIILPMGGSGEFFLSLVVSLLADRSSAQKRSNELTQCYCLRFLH